MFDSKRCNFLQSLKTLQLIPVPSLPHHVRLVPFLSPRNPQSLSHLRPRPASRHLPGWITLLTSLIIPRCYFLCNASFLCHATYLCYAIYLCYATYLCDATYLCYATHLCYGTDQCYGTYLCYDIYLFFSIYICFSTFLCYTSLLCFAT